MSTLKLIYCSLLFITACVLQACVSVDLQNKKLVKSDSVALVEPIKPFVEFRSEHLDRAWRNSTNGSTISYLSDCYNETDPSIESILRGVTADIQDSSTIQKNHIVYNDRAAIHTIVEGTVDGILTRFELTIFKKNHCIYILTYATTAENFETNQKEFMQFAEGFKAK